MKLHQKNNSQIPQFKYLKNLQAYNNKVFVLCHFPPLPTTLLCLSHECTTHAFCHQYLVCACMSNRSGGFFSKILKKRKEAQTPDNGELTLAQILNEKPPGGEGE